MTSDFQDCRLQTDLSTLFKTFSLKAAADYDRNLSENWPEKLMKCLLNSRKWRICLMTVEKG